ncbi:MAG TPA: hypothetical protein VFB90_01675 [Dehalococcoidia bacterium]|nr:hypothetical protein [Dehalococcoidia bacterium]
MTAAPDSRDFICQGWQYDPVMRQLRVYAQEKRNTWSAEPLSEVQLADVKRIVWHRWSQQPGRPHHGGDILPQSLSRIVVAFADGRELTLDENDRECAEKLANLLATESRVQLETAGAPSAGPSTLPQRDAQGRYRSLVGKTETALDMAMREIDVNAHRFPLRRSRQRIPFSEVRHLALEYSVKLPFEEYALVAAYGPEEQRLPVIVYRGWEGWADAEEWRRFAQELASELGVQLTSARLPEG